jgi:hypothetical protein
MTVFAKLLQKWHRAILSLLFVAACVLGNNHDVVKAAEYKDNESFIHFLTYSVYCRSCQGDTSSLLSGSVMALWCYAIR